jgi:hypothetical protein
MLIGDIREQELGEIWHGEKMQYYREHGGKLCSFCYDYMNVEGK